MARGAWHRTAHLMAYIASTVPQKKKTKPVTPQDCHRYPRKTGKRRLSRAESIARLNAMVGINSNGRN